MKKKIAALLLLLVLLPAMALCEIETCDAVAILQGETECDFNHDGVTNEEDARLALSYIAGTFVPDAMKASFTFDKDTLETGDTLSLCAAISGGVAPYTIKYEVIAGKNSTVLCEGTQEMQPNVVVEEECAGQMVMTVTDRNGTICSVQGGEIAILSIHIDAKGQFTYSITDNEITIEKWLDSDAQSAYIPDSIDEIPVTKIGESAFENQTNLASVRLPDSICVIGKAAFKGCTKLASMDAKEEK